MPIQSQAFQVPHPHSTVASWKSGRLVAFLLEVSGSTSHVNMTLPCGSFAAAPGICVPPHLCGPLHPAVSASGEVLEEMLDFSILPCSQNRSLALSYLPGAHVDNSHLIGPSVFWETLDS